MTTELRHLGVLGGLRGDRERLVTSLALPPPLMPPVDAHARLHGPYTAGGVIARAVTEATLRSTPELAHRHDIEIRALVPELRDAVPVLREALAESVPSTQRTRIYPRLRTRYLAHGLTDFIRDYLTELRGGGPYSLVIENLQHADRSDRELVAVLVRRLDASLLTIVACGAAGGPGTASGPGMRHGLGVANGLGAVGGLGRRGGPGVRAQQARWADNPLKSGAEGGDLLAEALAEQAVRVQAPERDPDAAARGNAPRLGPGDEASLAARYVHGDGVSDEPALLAAYARLSTGARARLHDARAGELGRYGGLPARLGAIPYHRERGSDSAGAGVRALTLAAEHCLAAGFHDAVVGFCARGRALASPERDPEHWWLLTSMAASSLAAVGRGVEAEALYDEARASSADPAVHRIAAYETAMLYARHHAPSRRDPLRAMTWINEAIAFAGLLRDPAERAFSLAFMTNGRALVEMRLGRTHRALALVDDGLAIMDRELPPASHPLDRCSLLANRARLLAMRGLLAEALDAQEAVIALDPTYGEHHFELGNLLHLRGRDDEALACYAEAQHLSLPFPELHYNRADLLAARGDDDTAVAEFGRVLELDQDVLDAYINRAGILAAQQDTARAWADVSAGLARDPANPYLLCILGQLEAEDGRVARARAAFDAAIAARPDLAAAWAGRAELQLEAGDPDAAAAGLTRALEQGDDAALLFNRAVAHRAAGRPQAARNDAEWALKLQPGDAETLALLAEIAAETAPHQ